MAGLSLAVIFVLGWIPLFVYRAETLTEALPSYHGAERLWVFLTPALLALHFTAACVALSLATAIPLWSAGIGLATDGLAVAFWFWGRTLIGPLRHRRLPDEPPRPLRCDGAFGIVRHPLYFSYLLVSAAPVLVAPRGILLVTFAMCLMGIVVRARQEERRLHAQLGAPYDEYCRKVKRLVPFLW